MTRNETFNGKREFPVTGWYFELLSTVNPVDVTIYGVDGRVLADERQVTTGFVHDRRGLDPFIRIEITTGGSEAVKIGISDGTTSNKVAPTSITSTVVPLGLTHTQAKKTVTSSSGTLLAANASRRYLLVQNQDAAGSVFLRCDGGGAAVADAGSVKLGPGDTWEPNVPPLSAITAIGDAASNANIQVIEA